MISQQYRLAKEDLQTTLAKKDAQLSHVRKALSHTTIVNMTTTTCLHDADAARLKSEENLRREEYRREACQVALQTEQAYLKQERLNHQAWLSCQKRESESVQQRLQQKEERIKDLEDLLERRGNAEGTERMNTSR
jgi:flagellar basal body rod protein FlgB